ncbi:MAG TPA: HAMP domain-containing sensor histidine kinase [Clostridia bacterium]|nr:HAMP domain-containing sensor histidine kinase [Clostridia bacterium]
MWINKKAFYSLRWRIAIAYLILIGIGFVVTNLSIIKVFENRQIHDKQERFRAYAVQVAQVISKDYSGSNTEMKENIIFDISQLGEDIMYREGGQPTRILILDANGIVDFDSYNDLSDHGFLKRNLRNDFPIIDDLLAGNDVDPTALHIGDRFSDQKWVMYSYSPIIYESQKVTGAVILSTSLSDIGEILEAIGAMLYRSSLVIIAFVILISIGISAYITRPIKSLTDVIRKMGQGHLGQRVKVRSVGEFRELGEAFNIMSEKLENLDRARSEFVSNASHELKTPLSAIKVLAESLIHMGGEVPEIYIEFLGDINKEIDRLNAVITDLLSLVEIDAHDKMGEKKVVDLARLVVRTVGGLRVLAEGKNISLETAIGSGSTTGNVVRLQQAVSNLVDNAIKYTPEGGRVSVDLYREEDQAIIKISDTGIGIPPEDIPHIFDRFFRVDKARSRYTGGTGLGLSITHRIILLHGGSIKVDSKEGRGTTFSISLPLWEEEG